MKRDPLQTILRVRQSTLEEAQKAVASAYQVERDASIRAEAKGILHTWLAAWNSN